MEDIHTGMALRKMPPSSASIPFRSLQLSHRSVLSTSGMLHTYEEKQRLPSLHCRLENRALPANEPVLTSVQDAVEKSEAAECPNYLI